MGEVGVVSYGQVDMSKLTCRTMCRIYGVDGKYENMILGNCMDGNIPKRTR